MVEFETFVKRFEKLPEYLKRKSGELLMKESGKIVELSNDQLQKGLNTEGRIMQRGYSPQYGKKRRKAGLQTSFVDLRFTGQYQDTKKLVKAKDGANIISDVDYEKYLRGNFPKHVGLTEENADRISELLADEVAVLIKKYLLR